MNHILSLFILASAIIGCEGGSTQLQQDKACEGYLKADGNDANTYKLITDCGYNYETPDQSGEHASAPFRHITQSYSEELKEYVFNFILHIQNDDDRGIATTTDRQRNEIKTDSKSPAFTVAQNGETLRITWKFRLPEGMKTTSKFAHIHQLKGIDNSAGNADVSQPLITYTVRSISGGQQFQIIYNEKNGSSWNTVYLAKTNLSDFLGQWVEATETVCCSDKGSYSVAIKRISDGKVLASVNSEGSTACSWDFWRDGCTGIRPKWGLYRNFGEGRSLADQLRDETLQFADFKIEKL